MSVQISLLRQVVLQLLRKEKIQHISHLMMCAMFRMLFTIFAEIAWTLFALSRIPNVGSAENYHAESVAFDHRRCHTLDTLTSSIPVVSGRIELCPIGNYLKAASEYRIISHFSLIHFIPWWLSSTRASTECDADISEESLLVSNDERNAMLRCVWNESLRVWQGEVGK